MPNPEEIVRQFCAAASDRDAQSLRRFFAEDVVYHNMPMDPVRGVDDTIATIEMFFAMCEALRFDIVHLAASGSVVLTERVDTFVRGGEERPLPVMGAFEVEDGRITAWRDYFDMPQASVVLGL